jgi:UDP-glucose 4-epimerase
VNIVVTGSAGHLGEGLMRTLRAAGQPVVGVDVRPSLFTDHVGTITDRAFVRDVVAGARAVIHAATLHKPHIATHSKQDFIDTNLTGTLNLLEEAVAQGVSAFVFTSTTSAFGSALTPSVGAPAAWITENVAPIPRNIYGVSKVAAENLCELFARTHRLPVIVLRTSRFFPEADDDADKRQRFTTANAQVNELLYRRVDLDDVVQAHLRAIEAAPALGWGKYIVSATTPFSEGELALLHRDAPAVIASLFPAYEDLFARRGWSMFAQIDRVYVNAAARTHLGWQPRYDFAHALTCLREGRDHRSALAIAVGSKGYHDAVFDDGPYPVLPT